MLGTRHRRAIALIVGVLWLLGVEVLPNLHLAVHADDHTHASDGTITQAGEHRHGDRVHVHGKPASEKKQTKRKQQRRDQLAFDDVELAHDAAGLAHHAIALHQPAPPVLAPLAVDSPSLVVEHPVDGLATSFALHRPQARGPPA